MARTVFGGSIVKNGYGNHPEEIYVCPRGFDGNYAVRISTVYTNPEKPPTRLTLETITHEGTSQEQKQSYELTPVNAGQAVVVHLTGGRRKNVLPFFSPLAILESMFNQRGAKDAKTRKKQPPAAGQPARAKTSCQAEHPRP